MERKKVLILAGRFPPYDNPGVRRPAGLYKYLADYGWEPWVITVDPEKGPNPYSYQPSDLTAVGEEDQRIIRTSYSNSLHLPRNLINRLLTVIVRGRDEPNLNRLPSHMGGGHKRNGVKSRLVYWLKVGARLIQDATSFPDNFFGWYPYALRAARELYAEVGYNAVISTSGPFTSHLIAASLKRQYPELIWIADYRDLWSQKVSRDQSWLFAALNQRLERRTLRRADAITAVSSSFVHKLSQFGFTVPIRLIYNGYDPDEYIHLPIIPATERLVITHAGSIYHGIRNPFPVLEALARLIAQGEIDARKIEVRFFGSRADWLEKAVSDLELDCVKVYERIPRTQILTKLTESTVLWTLDWSDDRETGNIPAKVYEYMGCRRLIFASGGTENSEVACLLNQTDIGLHVINKREKIELALQYLYQKYENEGCKGFVITHEATKAYTHNRMSETFALLLDTLVVKGQ